MVDPIERAESALCHERPDIALEALREIADPASLDADAFARFVVADASARLLPHPVSGESDAVDRVAMSLRRALERAAMPGARARIGRQLARCLAQKRCPSLALEAAQAAIDADPTSTAGPDALAFVHLQFDRRDEARTVLEAALSLDEAWRARLGLARVAYVTGEFARMERELDATPVTPFTEVAIARWRSVSARVRGDWEAHRAWLEVILAATPGGYRERGDRLELARTLYKLGRIDEAREGYRAVWRAEPEDNAGRFAREVLNTLEREDASAAEPVSLGPFPTITQKRNYCGPASLELVLRYLGVDGGDQDTIAAEVKLPSGSPMVRLTAYLESRGLAVRRFEATPERLRACLAAGLPVILQEEYSISTHVAVCTGIDERIGLLTVQDPMTHAPSERLVATQSRLGALFRNGALVACHADATDKLAALDAAGVVDVAHIRLLDSCDEGTDGTTGGPSPDEVIRRCREALRLCDDYLLARLRLCDELLDLARSYASQNNIGRFLVELRKLRVAYGNEERPHQIHARYLYWQDRVEEALIEYEDALRLDPGDSNNAQAVAECHQLAGRAPEATQAFWHALTIDPEHVRSTENLAAHALDQGDLETAGHLSACALDIAPRNPFNHVTAARVARETGDRATAIGHARRAVEIDPEHTYAARQLGEMLCTEAETRAQGIAVFMDLVTKHRGWFEPRIKAAHWMSEQGDVDAAVGLLRAGIDSAQDDPAALLEQLQDVLAMNGRVAEAVTSGQEIIARHDSFPMREKYLELLLREGHDADAMTLARTLYDEGPQGATRMYTLGDLLLERGDAEGEKLLRRTIDLAPTYHLARERLARHLMLDRAGDALVLLSAEAVELSPSLLAQRALAALELGRVDEARVAMDHCVAQGDVPTFEAHLAFAALEFERVAGGPAALFDRLETEDSRAPHVLRLRLALAIALGRDERIRALLPRVPDDSSTFTLVNSACEHDEAYRPELEKRLEAMLDTSARNGVAPGRWARGVLAGSHEARGVEGALDGLVRASRRASHIACAVRSLNDFRHRALIDRVHALAAAQEPDSRDGAEEHGSWLFHQGDRVASRQHLDAAAGRWTRSTTLLDLLSAELLLAGDTMAHAAVDRRARLGLHWTYPSAMMAASARLRGDHATAQRWITRAEREAWATGWHLSDHPLVTGIAGAIRHDAAAVAHARDASGAMLYRGARMWDELTRATSRSEQATAVAAP